MLALPVHAQDSLRASIPSMHHTSCSNRRRVCLIRSNNVIGSSSAANASAPGVFPGLSSSNISLRFRLVCQHRSISRWVQDRCRKQIRERLKRHCLLLVSFYLTHHAVKRFDIDTMLRDPWNHDFRACPKSVRQPKPVAFLLSFTVCLSMLALTELARQERCTPLTKTPLTFRISQLAGEQGAGAYPAWSPTETVYRIPGAKRWAPSQPSPKHDDHHARLDAELLFLGAYRARGHVVFFGSAAGELTELATLHGASVVSVPLESACVANCNVVLPAAW